MPYQSQYQLNNPYGRDPYEPINTGRGMSGLGSLIGRGLHAAIGGERLNPAFDKSKPVGAQEVGPTPSGKPMAANLPFKPAGFGRALAGDRSNTFNQYEYGQQEQDQRKDDDVRLLQGLIAERQKAKDQNAWERMGETFNQKQDLLHQGLVGKTDLANLNWNNRFVHQDNNLDSKEGIAGDNRDAKIEFNRNQQDFLNRKLQQTGDNFLLGEKGKADRIGLVGQNAVNLQNNKADIAAKKTQALLNSLGSGEEEPGMLSKIGSLIGLTAPVKNTTNSWGGAFPQDEELSEDVINKIKAANGIQ